MFGHLDPDVMFGLQNSFTYKGVAFNIDFDGALGGVMPSTTVRKMWWGGTHPNSVEYRHEDNASGGVAPKYVPDGVNIVSGELVRDVDGTVISDDRVFKENTTATSWQTWCQNYPYRAKVNETESKEFANVLNRSYVKLRKVSFTYDLAPIINSKVIKGLDVSLYGYNLWIWKKAIIVDPDFGDDDQLQDPSTRYLGMSVKLTF